MKVRRITLVVGESESGVVFTTDAGTTGRHILTLDAALVASVFAAAQAVLDAAVDEVAAEVPPAALTTALFAVRDAKRTLDAHTRDAETQLRSAEVA